MRARGSHVLSLPAIAAAALLACESTREAPGAAKGLPGVRTPATVIGVVERGPYLDAHLLVGRDDLRFFFPANERCRAILRDEARATYVRRGPLGEVEAAPGEPCIPVGIASLRVWRDRQPRTRLDEPLPRAPVSFRVVYRDDDLVFARGRFPLASQIGWAGGDDTIALLPASEGCRETIESGEGAMEYRAAGPVPFRIVAGGADCPIVGFVQPLPDE